MLLINERMAPLFTGHGRAGALPPGAADWDAGRAQEGDSSPAEEGPHGECESEKLLYVIYIRYIYSWKKWSESSLVPGSHVA